ncbi:MAG: class I SAM-dependent methyltransferase [Abitibacteriaceae bacterium]|nr:class I SAM-dependent methyltransferase [Abditibacteriaceae bacterium]MBV9868833.1 class I SAM-dependent methyltransferase [Abditibacteriaceae bacterium]
MSQPNLSPDLFFETANAYQRSAALKAAVELGVFTAIGKLSQDGSQGATAEAVAAQCGASQRGIRILCDYLTIIGFITKEGQSYSLTPATTMFLNQSSPAYVGGALRFLNSPMIMQGFNDLTTTVRQGRTTLPAEGSVTPDHPMWVDFARGMAPLMMMPAQGMVGLVQGDTAHPLATDRPLKVLDIAAGHGVFGIAFARQFPNAQITAVDWQNVLQVAQENAAASGVSDRYHLLPGSAFEVDFGGGYDLILITNFLHHFDVATNEQLLRKIRAAMAPDGRALTLEFVPNDDRISPPMAAAFSLTMLGSTPSGDAYTFAQLESMFRNAGFSQSELHTLPPTLIQVVTSYP